MKSMGGANIFIIAEAGVNHNGSLDMAREMIKVAANAGADAVKFQTFRADALVTEKADKADYQKKTSGARESQFDMLKRLELSLDDHQVLMEMCRTQRIEFLSSPFDLGAIDLLAGLGVRKWKIPSGEITNLPYLRKIASFQQETILSTGMADMKEIGDALAVLFNVRLDPSKITVLHCCTEYPAPMEDVNLLAMKTIQAGFPEIRVGYSDHTHGIEIPVAAAALGASVIEKHFTLDRNLPGPDHRASLEPDELEAMIRAIRNVELAMGSGFKGPTPSERKNMAVARKSIVAARDISAGEVLTADNLTVKRPGIGISPMKWDEILGRHAKKDYHRDDLIDA